QPIAHPGQGTMSAFDRPSQAVRCARAIVAELGRLGHEAKAAIHTGECEAAGDGLEGVAVRACAEICDLAGPSEVLASQTGSDLIAGSGIELRDRGERDGSPGRWHLYAVTGDEPTDARPAGSVDRRTAALTPGPRETMTRVDRAALALAKRAP